MPDVFDGLYGALDPLLAYRYRRSSGETLPPQQQQEVFRYQNGQPAPILMTRCASIPA